MAFRKLLACARGTSERRRFERALIRAWLAAFGAVAADAGAQLQAETLAGTPWLC